MKQLMKRDRKTLHCDNLPENCTQESLLEYFKQFDDTVQISIQSNKKKTAIIICADAKIADNIARMEHSINDESVRVLKVKRGHKFKVKKGPREGNQSHDPNQWLSNCIRNLKSTDDLETQFDNLVENVTLTNDDIAVRQAMCSQLEAIFSKIIPVCRIVPFGSFVNGLGMRNGDVDVVLDLGFQINQSIYFNQQAKGSSKKLLSKLTARPHFARAELEQKTESDILILLQCLVTKHFPNVQKVYCLHRTTVPILGFTIPGADGAEGIHYDISVNRAIGAENSRLVRFLQTLDNRVRPLLIAVLVWAKKKWPRSQNERPSSYALVMMVVTFLQSRPKPVLPSIDTLQKLAKATKTIDQFKCHFCDDVENITKTENTETKGELFQGFINFLVEHNFHLGVISPLHGCTMTSEEFLSRSEAKGFHFGYVNVQDPFETSRNLTKSITERGATRMKQTLDVELKTMQSSDWGLDTLLQEDNNIVFLREKKMMKNRKRKKKRKLGTIPKELNSVAPQ